MHGLDQFRSERGRVWGETWKQSNQEEKHTGHYFKLNPIVTSPKSENFFNIRALQQKKIIYQLYQLKQKKQFS